MNPGDGEFNPSACYVCGAFVGDLWFGRIRQGEGRICVCSPRCSMLYLTVPQPEATLADRPKYYRDQILQLRATRAPSEINGAYDEYLATRKNW